MKTLQFTTKIITVCAFIATTLLSCISFNEASIKEGTKTFYVEEFNLSPGAALGPADLGITFSEKLKERIRSDSQLFQDDLNPHVSFSGEITSFRVTSEAPSGDSPSSDFQRLSIGIKVKFEDAKYPDDNFEKSFSLFESFDAGASLLDVQDQLINEIFENLTYQVFNAAFSNW